MRKYTIPNWGKAVDTLAKLSAKKKYAVRFRLAYFQHLSANSSGKNVLKNNSQNLLSFINIYRYLIKHQLFRKRIKLTDYNFTVFISTNPSFIKTVTPVINLLIERGENPLILCGGNHYNQLKNILPGSIFQHVHICESVWAGNRFSAFLRLIAAPFLAVKDAVWLAFQDVEKAGSAASDFARYALVHHFFSKVLTEQFNQKKLTLIAAVDYWFWESLLFTTAKETVTNSIVLQHGKLSDLYYPLLAKQFYAWGEADYEEMTQKYLAKPEEIIKIGSPYFDNLYIQIKENTSNAISKSGKNIIFYAQPYGEHQSMSPQLYIEVLNWIKALKKYLPNHNISLKLHPFDKAAFYGQHVNEIDVLEGDLISALASTDIMITVDSTTALEAAVAKIPTIQCLPLNHSVYSDMSQTGLTLKTESQDELFRIVDQLLTDKAFLEQTIYTSSKALNYYFYNLGRSLNKIEKMLLSD